MSEQVQAEGQEAAPALSDVETRARRMGWLPKELFRGNPDLWRSADEFMARGEHELPLLRERFKNLDTRFGAVENELRSTKQLLEEQARASQEFLQYSRGAEERAYARAKRELEDKMDVAVAHADTDAAKRARVELAELERTAPQVQVPTARTNGHAPQYSAQQAASQPQAQPRQQPDPVAVDWMRENDWFNRDEELNAHAQFVHQKLMREQPGLALRDNLAEVKQRVMQRYPEKFGNPRREAATAVATPAGGTAAPRKRGKTFDDLPADAKVQCEKFVKQIPGYKREEYVKDYFAKED